MIEIAIKKVADHSDLDSDLVAGSVREIVDGKASAAQIGALLLGLKMKGETPAEMAAFATALRQFSVRLFPKISGRIIDTCGTGGDMSGTFNVSTLAAIVASGAGAKVAKHGNRSVSSRCGSADLLEKLGLNLNASPESVQKSLEEIGIGFLFAPAFHPALKKVAGIRKELGIRTIFNLMGPLLNPVPIRGQLMGVYSESLVPVMAEALKISGLDEAIVVHGSEGVDEISVRGKTVLSWLKDRKIRTFEYTPEEMGVRLYTEPPIRIANAEESATLTMKILSGDADGLAHDMVVVNAAGALVVSGLVDDFKEGCELANLSIETGAALKKLQALVSFAERDSIGVKQVAENTT